MTTIASASIGRTHAFGISVVGSVATPANWISPLASRRQPSAEVVGSYLKTLELPLLPQDPANLISIIHVEYTSYLRHNQSIRSIRSSHSGALRQRTAGSVADVGARQRAYGREVPAPRMLTDASTTDAVTVVTSKFATRTATRRAHPPAIYLGRTPPNDRIRSVSARFLTTDIYGGCVCELPSQLPSVPQIKHGVRCRVSGRPSVSVAAACRPAW